MCHNVSKPKAYNKNKPLRVICKRTSLNDHLGAASVRAYNETSSTLQPFCTGASDVQCNTIYPYRPENGHSVMHCCSAFSQQSGLPMTHCSAFSQQSGLSVIAGTVLVHRQYDDRRVYSILQNAAQSLGNLTSSFGGGSVSVHVIIRWR